MMGAANRGSTGSTFEADHNAKQGSVDEISRRDRVYASRCRVPQWKFRPGYTCTASSDDTRHRAWRLDTQGGTSWLRRNDRREGRCAGPGEVHAAPRARLHAAFGALDGKLHAKRAAWGEELRPRYAVPHARLHAASGAQDGESHAKRAAWGEQLRPGYAVPHAGLHARSGAQDGESPWRSRSSSAVRQRLDW